MKMNLRTITQHDQDQLLALTADPDPVTARQAKVVLMTLDGNTQGNIAQSLGISERTVRGVLKKYKEDGVARLRRRGVSGRPKSISQTEREGLMNLIRRSPKEFQSDSPFWNLAHLVVVAKREGVLGDISAGAMRREITCITKLVPELRERLELTDAPRPGAPRGNQNTLRHGAYRRSAPSGDEQAMMAETEARLRQNFPAAGSLEPKLIWAVASACLMLQRALSANCLEAAVRVDRRLRKAIQELKSAEQSRRRSSSAKFAPAQWAANLLRRDRKE